MSLAEPCSSPMDGAYSPWHVAGDPKAQTPLHARDSAHFGPPAVSRRAPILVGGRVAFQSGNIFVATTFLDKPPFIYLWRPLYEKVLAPFVWPVFGSLAAVRRGHPKTSAPWKFRSRIGEPVMQSSAQNREDVMLARVFDHKSVGFYIDVGAMDPDEMSTTRYFYDLGWRGINIEPDPRFFGRLVESRPRDINLPIALSSKKGRRDLFVSQTIGLTSLFSERVRDYGEIQRHSVETNTLAAVCAGHVREEIDFLKVDVEGAEAEVLRGANWRRFRPKIVLVESTAVNSYEPTWQAWDPILTGSDYKLVYEDGINRFYCRLESLELEGAFRFPPNVLDNYVTADLIKEQVKRNEAEKQVADLKRQLARLEGREQVAENRE